MENASSEGQKLSLDGSGFGEEAQNVRGFKGRSSNEDLGVACLTEFKNFWNA